MKILSYKDSDTVIKEIIMKRITGKELRKLGFETFSKVVNEHYDNIENHVLRFDHAFEQCQWLSKQDPVEIYSQIQGELEHNCDLVLNLKNKTLQQMHDLLKTKIPKLI
jgi:hypothetical protein